MRGDLQGRANGTVVRMRHNARRGTLSFNIDGESWVEATQTELAKPGRQSAEGIERVIKSSVGLLHLVGITSGDSRLFSLTQLEDIDVTSTVLCTLREDPWTLMGRLTFAIVLVVLDPVALMFGLSIVVDFDVVQRPPLDEAPLQCPISISAFFLVERRI